jgi:hypothetical protein
MIAFYIVGLSTMTLRNALFMNSTDSIVEKTVVIMRTATEIEEKAGLKIFWCFPIIHHLKCWFANKKESELLRSHKEKHTQDARMIDILLMPHSDQTLILEILNLLLIRGILGSQ